MSKRLRGRDCDEAGEQALSFAGACWSLLELEAPLGHLNGGASLNGAGWVAWVVCLPAQPGPAGKGFSSINMCHWPSIRILVKKVKGNKPLIGEALPYGKILSMQSEIACDPPGLLGGL